MSAWGGAYPSVPLAPLAPLLAQLARVARVPLAGANSVRVARVARVARMGPRVARPTLILPPVWPQWIALCSESLTSPSSGLLLVFILLSPFRAACSLFSNFRISLKRLAPGVLNWSSPFRVVYCALFSNSLVSFEGFAQCS